MNLYSEDALIEQPAINLLGQLGWKIANLRQTRDLFLSAFGQRGGESGGIES